ncbi:TIM barrel protein [Candidatus Pacearchaeota archaeon]|nr:TIM barrel protein [Candidatus Pacearchaeota archaeon]
MTIRFGPAGLGLAKKGLKACEIAFTYGVYIKNDSDALRIGKKARELDIELSVHAPYWVNLNSEEKAKREATKQRILDSCRVGELLGAKVVVFHPGYYGKDKDKAYETIREGIVELMKEIKAKGWKIKIAPETMGKINVFGSVEEISKLVQETGCSFCIDFAHVLARDKEVDYSRIEKAFPQKEWHCHFSGIVYGEKGEKHHITTPLEKWKELLAHLPRDRGIRIINESPSMIEDCAEGLAILKSLATPR